MPEQIPCEHCNGSTRNDCIYCDGEGEVAVLTPAERKELRDTELLIADKLSYLSKLYIIAGFYTLAFKAKEQSQMMQVQAQLSAIQ